MSQGKNDTADIAASDKNKRKKKKKSLCPQCAPSLWGREDYDGITYIVQVI